MKKLKILVAAAVAGLFALGMVSPGRATTITSATASRGLGAVVVQEQARDEIYESPSVFWQRVTDGFFAALYASFFLFPSVDSVDEPILGVSPEELNDEIIAELQAN